MYKKFNVLSKALELGTFDAASLAQQTDTKLVTVQTILSRAPSEWFDQERVATGTRGGQPRRFRLTRKGRAAIAAELEKLPQIGAYHVAAPAAMEPVGLNLAREALSRLARTAPGAEDVPSLALHIRRNIEWAEAEIAEAPHESDRARYREELARARQELEVREALERDRQSVPRAEECFANALSAVHVWIGKLGNDDRAARMANSVRMAVQSVSEAFKTGDKSPLEATVVDLDAQTLGQLWEKSGFRNTAEAEFLVCVNSRENPNDLIRSLDTLKKSSRGARLAWALLDVAESAELAQYAEKKQLAYTPHAETDLSWVSAALLRRT